MHAAGLVLPVAAALVAGACGGQSVSSNPPDAGAPSTDAAAGDGSDASQNTACVPGRAVQCAGLGGCISNQVCNAEGTAYGDCACAGDGGAVLCVPGQSITCGGPGGCSSFQVCNASGTGYGPCDCPEGGAYEAGGAAQTFEVDVGGSAVQPLSCPSAHWEFAGLTPPIVLRNTGSVPLAYYSTAIWQPGVQHTPGVPTGANGEQVGVLAVGEQVSLQGGATTIALLGAARAFSNYSGGYAPADEWTIPWPMGVSGSGGSPTMYVAEINAVSSCSSVWRP